MISLMNEQNRTVMSSFDVWYANIYQLVPNPQNQDVQAHSGNILDNYRQLLSSLLRFCHETCCQFQIFNYATCLI